MLLLLVIRLHQLISNHIPPLPLHKILLHIAPPNSGDEASSTVATTSYLTPADLLFGSSFSPLFHSLVESHPLSLLHIPAPHNQAQISIPPNSFANRTTHLHSAATQISISSPSQSLTVIVSRTPKMGTKNSQILQLCVRH